MNSLYKHHLGFALFEIKRYNEAVIELKKCIRLNPDDVDVYFNLGNIYEKLNEYINAAEAYEKYLSLIPDSDKKQEIKNKIDSLKVMPDENLPQEIAVVKDSKKEKGFLETIKRFFHG